MKLEDLYTLMQDIREGIGAEYLSLDCDETDVFTLSVYLNDNNYEFAIPTIMLEVLTVEELVSDVRIDILSSFPYNSSQLVH